MGSRESAYASAAKSFASSGTPSSLGSSTSFRTRATMSIVVSTRQSSGTSTSSRWFSLYRPTFVRS